MDCVIGVVNWFNCAYANSGGFRRRAPVVSESPARSGEEVSPKKECVIVPLFLSSSPRLGERSSHE
ncbi:hypothetical protein DEO72_LG10g1981 [Vigna unguiculata]|uniref:Uncharacterized protein n=1 Tax=Vigna unguiculata TaxID=3917 RepID=A0A4D6NA44_VIGUN|nr:hypothetical protein DEO72_LG10g1981 [Vigna unguiculata]